MPKPKNAPKLNIPVDVHADLMDTLGERADTTIVLPGGGADALYDYLTCEYQHNGRGRKCGKFVCYRHNEDLRPKHRDKVTNIPHPTRNEWSNPIPQRVIQEFEDGLKLTIEEEK